MKLKEGFILRKIANTDVVIPVGKNIANFNGIITLNETAAFLWGLLKNGIDIPAMVEALISEYDVSREKAREDIEAFAKQLSEANMLEEVSKGELM